MYLVNVEEVKKKIKEDNGEEYFIEQMEQLELPLGDVDSE